MSQTKRRRHKHFEHAMAPIGIELTYEEYARRRRWDHIEGFNHKAMKALLEAFRELWLSEMKAMCARDEIVWPDGKYEVAERQDTPRVTRHVEFMQSIDESFRSTLDNALPESKPFLKDSFRLIRATHVQELKAIAQRESFEIEIPDEALPHFLQEEIKQTLRLVHSRS